MQFDKVTYSVLKADLCNLAGWPMQCCSFVGCEGEQLNIFHVQQSNIDLQQISIDLQQLSIAIQGLVYVPTASER